MSFDKYLELSKVKTIADKVIMDNRSEDEILKDLIKIKKTTKYVKYKEGS